MSGLSLVRLCRKKWEEKKKKGLGFKVYKFRILEVNLRRCYF